MEILLDLITAVISVYFSYMFFGLFAPKRTDKWIVDGGLIVFASATFFVTIHFIEELLPRMVLIISITLLVSSLFSMKLYNRFLLSFVNYAINGAAELVIGAAVSKIFSVDMNTCFQGKYLVLGLFLSKMFVFIIISFIRARKHKLLSASFRKDFLALFIIPISTFVIFLLQYNYFMHLPDITNYIAITAMICYFILLLANILVFNILDNVYNTVEKDYRIATSEKLILFQEEQYRQVMKHTNTILKIKHDQKNFLLGVISDLDSGNYEDIRSAVKNEFDSLNVQTVPPGKNSVIYSLVEHKADIAAQKGIQLVHEYHEIPKINISPIDIAIILGNALDNAIEATEKVDTEADKVITLLIKIHNDQILIVIKNPTNGTVDVKNMRSSKESMFHGFGVLSMKNLAQAHNGTVVFTTEENIFQTRIILRNTNE